MLSSEILLTIKLNEQLFADPRRIELLRQIQKIGSISQAAKLADVSYKTAWDNIDAMNKLSPKPLLERNVGGKQGGGTRLTAYAERLLQLYDLLKQIQERAFTILHQEEVSLDNLLVATACSSLKTSARNQFFGTVSVIQIDGIYATVSIQVKGLPHPINAQITLKSYERLALSLEKEVMVMIKAPWVNLAYSSHSENVFSGKITHLQKQDDEVEVLINVNDIEFCAATTKPVMANIGETISFSIDPEQIILATL